MEAFLTLKDRCDKCNAAARVKVDFSNGPLMFCNHHFNHHKDAIEAQGGKIALNSNEQEPEKVKEPANI